ncbi:MAG: hypothetical protein LBJ43_05595, partial [Propionibacteriaceae bacterium]|nr:hypothetical protein [Propionibacteriaceae bacterium]
FNPFVIVADAAPSGTAPSDFPYALSENPLSLIKLGVRYARIGESVGEDRCGVESWIGDYHVAPHSDGTFIIDPPGSEAPRISQAATYPPSPVSGHDIDNPVWPWGMASNLIIAVLFFRLAVKRLAVPYGVLPAGQRVA